MRSITAGPARCKRPTIRTVTLSGALGLVCLLCSCVSISSGEARGREALLQTVLSTRPIGSQPVFLGTAARHRDREDEEAISREHAALQAARFVELRGEAAFFSERTRMGTEYVHSVSIDDDFVLAEELEGELETVSVYTDDSGTYGLFLLPDYTVGDLRYSPRGSDGTPRWIDRTPEIPGYFAGVGSARPTRVLRDSIEAADRRALFAILAQFFVEVRSGRFERVVDGGGVQTGSAGIQRTRGRIRGFYVLDRWVGDDGTVFTLAVCPKSLNS